MPIRLDGVSRRALRQALLKMQPWELERLDKRYVIITRIIRDRTGTLPSPFFYHGLMRRLIGTDIKTGYHGLIHLVYLPNPRSTTLLHELLHVVGYNEAQVRRRLEQ